MSPRGPFKRRRLLRFLGAAPAGISISFSVRWGWLGVIDLAPLEKRHLAHLGNGYCFSGRARFSSSGGGSLVCLEEQDPVRPCDRDLAPLHD